MLFWAAFVVINWALSRLVNVHDYVGAVCLIELSCPHMTIAKTALRCRWFPVESVVPSHQDTLNIAHLSKWLQRAAPKVLKLFQLWPWLWLTKGHTTKWKQLYEVLQLTGEVTYKMRTNCFQNTALRPTSCWANSKLCIMKVALGFQYCLSSSSLINLITFPQNNINKSHVLTHKSCYPICDGHFTSFLRGSWG